MFEAHEAKQIETLEFGAGPSKEMRASCSKQPQAPQRVLVRHFYFILFIFFSGLSVLLKAGSSGLDCGLPERAQPLLPLPLLGLQVLFVLVEPAAHGTCFLGPQIRGLVLLALIEFPEVLFLSLVNDGQHTGDGFANHSDLGEFGSRAACHFSHVQLGQFHLEVLQLFQQLLLLLAAKVSSLNLGHGCIIRLLCLLGGKAISFFKINLFILIGG